MSLLRHAWLLSVALAACAAPAASWEKPGATQAAVDEAMQQCRLTARLAPPPNLGPISPPGLGNPGVERIEDREARETQEFQRCMRDKGFTLKR